MRYFRFAQRSYLMQRSDGTAPRGMAAAIFSLALTPVCLASSAAQAGSLAQPHPARFSSLAQHLERMESPASPLQLPRDKALWAALAFEDAVALGGLLHLGADPNKPEELSRMTPLMAAETHALAAALLTAGANANARDRHGRTPLHYAVRMREARLIIPLLLSHGADPNARANEGTGATPLFAAIEYYIEDVDKARAAQTIRLLAEAGADVNATDGRGDTILALAAVNNEPQLAKLLLQLGANPVQRLKDGKTAMDYARERGASEVAAVLKSAALTNR